MHLLGKCLRAQKCHRLQLSRLFAVAFAKVCVRFLVHLLGQRQTADQRCQQVRANCLRSLTILYSDCLLDESNIQSEEELLANILAVLRLLLAQVLGCRRLHSMYSQFAFGMRRSQIG